MDRRVWLAERRAAVEADYDHDAPSYDTGLYPISEVHKVFVGRVVDQCPPDGVVLDIPCGTGRYFDLVVGRGRRVVGADQSSGMAAQARARSLAQSVKRAGLQELTEIAAFDGVLCIDAMEHVPPEDWPIVVGNLARALRAGGLLYLTLEVMTDQEAELRRAYEEAIAQGMPIVPGESVAEETGGYHFYPSDTQVAGWLFDAGLGIVDDVTDLAYDEWGYRHLLLRHLGVA